MQECIFFYSNVVSFVCTQMLMNAASTLMIVTAGVREEPVQIPRVASPAAVKVDIKLRRTRKRAMVGISHYFLFE